MVEIDTALVINHDVHEPVLTFKSEVGKNAGVLSVADRDYRDLESYPLSQVNALISNILLRRHADFLSLTTTTTTVTTILKHTRCDNNTPKSRKPSKKRENHPDLVADRLFGEF